jgi:hypothetical protein
MENLKTYTIDESLVNSSKLHNEIMLSNSIDGFIGIQIENDELSVYGNSITDETLLNSKIANHSKIDSLNDEIAKYYERQHDGKVAIIQLMAELRLNAIANNYPRIVNATIENAFWDVAISINNGWWITAMEKSDLVVVGGYVTQELKDRIQLKISTYISQNY